ncbi:MAG: hypothetical protein NTX17_05710 [Candidatus Eisenbacteria bacterium]|nr:hypothetical protein [Candidatus Eisenbacteria bacterium]
MRKGAYLFRVALLVSGVVLFSPSERTVCFANGKESWQTNGGDASVSFYPQHVSIEPAARCTLQVLVQDTIDSLSCMECVITFDTLLVRLVSTGEGNLFKKAAFPTFFESRHTAPDTESVADCVLGYRSYFLPPGELVRFVFEAKESGACLVRIVKMRLWDINRDELFPVLEPDAWVFVGASTGIEPMIVSDERLTSCPNPFNRHTSLILRLPLADTRPIESRASASVYSLAGRKIRLIFDGRVVSGENRMVWDGRDECGNEVPPGIYFAITNTEGEIYRTKLVLIR